MLIGSLIQIGNTKHVIIDKFWVGFETPENDLHKEHYYETFSMGEPHSQRRTAIACRDFKTGMEEGNIKILSSA